MESLAGQLLVASPSLLDPNFHRTVVLVTAHDENGAMGLVLNRPSEATVGEALPELLAVAEREAPVHVGGPVEPAAVLAVGEFDRPDEAAAIIFDKVGFLTADAAKGDEPADPRRVRVFVGYAGWGAGQLEEELGEEAWILADPLPDDVFEATTFALWSDVLRRKGGGYALVATMPPDPSLN